MQVSVVVRTWNSAELLRRTLGGLAAQAEQVLFQVPVVENGSAAANSLRLLFRRICKA